jgi:hypothetical protein
MAIVHQGGVVRAGETITVPLPRRPWQNLPAI